MARSLTEEGMMEYVWVVPISASHGTRQIAHLVEAKAVSWSRKLCGSRISGMVNLGEAKRVDTDRYPNKCLQCQKALTQGGQSRVVYHWLDDYMITPKDVMKSRRRENGTRPRG